jgi:hypothetical protein
MRPVAPHYSNKGERAVPLARARAADTYVQEHPMLDIVMLALGFGFFVAGIGYAYACERL